MDCAIWDLSIVFQRIAYRVAGEPDLSALQQGAQEEVLEKPISDWLVHPDSVKVFNALVGKQSFTGGDSSPYAHANLAIGVLAITTAQLASEDDSGEGSAPLCNRALHRAAQDALQKLKANGFPLNFMTRGAGRHLQALGM